MLRRSVVGRRSAAVRGRPSVRRWLLMMAALCIAIRLISPSGSRVSAGGRIGAFFSREDVVETLYRLETGGRITAVSRDAAVAAESQAEVPSDSEVSPPAVTAPQSDSSALGDDAPGVAACTPISPADVFSGEVLSAAGIRVKNNTDYELDLESMLNEPTGVSAADGPPTVLIVHTHGSESYMPDGDDQYIESDPSRTEDRNYNVVRVGNELQQALESYGIPVIHDTTLHDYPTYTGSYTRSLATIEANLEEHPEIQVVIDVHRDAMENADGSIYRSTVEVEGHECAQILLVMGTDSSGLYHPDWRENLKLALRLEYAMNTLYPTLAKPITLSEYRYNQHATTGSMILEVGTNGNTLQEALTAVRYFADAAAAVLLDGAES